MKMSHAWPVRASRADAQSSNCDAVIIIDYSLMIQELLRKKVGHSGNVRPHGQEKVTDQVYAHFYNFCPKK